MVIENNSDYFIQKYFSKKKAKDISLHLNKLDYSRNAGYVEKDLELIFMFMDIVNYSTLFQISSFQEKTIIENMINIYSNCENIVKNNGGMLVNFSGDEMFSILGYPKLSNTTLYDSLEIGAKLIFKINSILERWASNLDQEPNITGVRIGMALGKGIFVHTEKAFFEDLFIFGESINFAKRLESNSRVNGILISQPFFNKLTVKTKELFEDCKLKSRHTKGFTEKITAYQLSEKAIIGKYR